MIYVLVKVLTSFFDCLCTQTALCYIISICIRVHLVQVYIQVTDVQYFSKVQNFRLFRALSIADIIQTQRIYRGYIKLINSNGNNEGTGLLLADATKWMYRSAISRCNYMKVLVCYQQMKLCEGIGLLLADATI